MDQEGSAQWTSERLREVDQMAEDTGTAGQRLNEILRRVADMEIELDETVPQMQGAEKQEGEEEGEHESQFEEWCNISDELATLKAFVEQQKAATDRTSGRLSSLRSDLVSLSQD